MDSKHEDLGFAAVRLRDSEDNDTAVVAETASPTAASGSASASSANGSSSSAMALPGVAPSGERGSTTGFGSTVPAIQLSRITRHRSNSTSKSNSRSHNTREEKLAVVDLNGRDNKMSTPLVDEELESPHFLHSAIASPRDESPREKIHQRMHSSSSAGAFSAVGANHFGTRLTNVVAMMYDDSSEVAEEEVEMMDYDNPEDHVHERRLEDEEDSSLFSRGLRLTGLRVVITIVVGIIIGLTGYVISTAVKALIHGNLSVISSLMNQDSPAAAFFATLIISLCLTFFSALMVTFGSWQIRGSGVGRLNAYLSGMYSSRFLVLKNLFLKIAGLILNVGAGIKHGMEGPFIHIGAMASLHVSRFCLTVLRLTFGRCGIEKYTKIISGVVDDRMFITSGAAAGFSVAFNAPIAAVLYVQDGAFAYWNGEYTLRTFICTMTAVTTINFCFISNNVLPTRGLIDVERAASVFITVQEFWGFVVLGLMGGVFGALFTKLNLSVEKLRMKHLGRRRLPNILDVAACTTVTILLAFVLPFMLSCADQVDMCTTNSDRCVQFSCGPGSYSDLATFFFTLPEETIRILFDRSVGDGTQQPTVSAMIVFCIFYFLMAAITYNMAVPGGLFIPSIIIGATYGRLIGMFVQAVSPAEATDQQANPGAFSVIGAASMLGGMTRMTLPISVMMIEVTSDAQFLIPIMLSVLLAKVVADRLIGGLYLEHLKLDGLLMVFGDKMPRILTKLNAGQIMSKRVEALPVIATVSECVKLIENTKHHAFVVIDNEHGTLKVANRRTSLQPPRSRVQTFSNDVQHQPFLGGSGAESPQSPSDSKLNLDRGVTLGLIQRRHLKYVLCNMPCFATPSAARDSEPMTAETGAVAVSAAMSAGIDTKATLLNVDGASVTASFVDWVQRQDPFAQNAAANASGGLSGNAISAPSIAGQPASPRPVDPHPLLSSSGTATTPTATALRPAATPVLQSSVHSSWASRVRKFLGDVSSDSYDLHVTPNSLPCFVNLSAFMDPGAYIVTEDTPARRVWSMFRSLGMRHIIVVNQHHQPVGVITRGDLIQHAVAD